MANVHIFEPLFNQKRLTAPPSHSWTHMYELFFTFPTESRCTHFQGYSCRSSQHMLLHCIQLNNITRCSRWGSAAGSILNIKAYSVSVWRISLLEIQMRSSGRIGGQFDWNWNKKGTHLTLIKITTPVHPHTATLRAHSNIEAHTHTLWLFNEPPSNDTATCDSFSTVVIFNLNTVTAFSSVVLHLCACVCMNKTLNSMDWLV